MALLTTGQSNSKQRPWGEVKQTKLGERVCGHCNKPNIRKINVSKFMVILPAGSQRTKEKAEKGKPLTPQQLHPLK